MTGRQLLDLLQDRARAVHVSELNEFAKRSRRDRQLQIRQVAKNSKLRTENESALILVKEERFLTETIAPKQKLLFCCIPNCEREHAAQFLEKQLAPAFICMHEHLGVALALEVVVQFF